MVPLTVRSHYSLMWGSTPVGVLCRQARRLGYRRLALTDTDNLYGLWSFLRACRREGIAPIVGAEITEPGSRRRAVCLVKNARGYARLCRLITRRKTAPRFNLQTALAELGRDFWVLTGVPGLIEAWHAEGLSVAAAMPRRPLPPGHPLCRTAGRLGVPLVATPGSFYLTPQDASLHRLQRAIDGNTSLSRLDLNRTAPPDAWLASPAVYARRFAVCPAALRATRRIAADLTFTGPEFGVVLPPWPSAEGSSSDAALRQAAYDGAHRRYGKELPEPLVERLEQELRVIAGKGFSAYFLIVSEIVSKSPRTCGRGSAAASLVAYCLGITNVCPLKHNLYFARFLNPGRSDPPDIDVDFAWDERDAVIASVLARYQGHAAMVSSIIRFQPRMALREAARVYGLTEQEIGRVSKRLPWYWHVAPPAGGLLSQLTARPELKDQAFPDPWPEILALAQRLVDMPRHISVHPGGVVITPHPVADYVPVENAPKGVPVIQWDKDAAEAGGLVKIDLLGNRSLGVIRDALAGLRRNGRLLDEHRWQPEDDPATQQAIAQGRTMGCFYIESPAMRLLHKKAGVGDFDHLVIHSSIIRPAANEFIREYVRRLHGGSWDPIHPLLADVLSETFGIMVYQEDVSRAAEALAGFSAAEADGLRKVLSKKHHEARLEDFRQRFFSGARSRGVPQDKIADVWQMMMSFNGYSFCKPHSASYARVSFQAAYLKEHHPAEFMAAVISNQGGFYSTFAYVSEARRMGLAVLPPDVRTSRRRWDGQGARLQAGLMAVATLAHGTCRRIINQRQRRPFSDLFDFLERVRPEDNEARAMVHAGALDGLLAGAHRGRLLWELARWQHQRHNHQRPIPLPLSSLSAAAAPPQLPPQPTYQRLRREFAALGFLCDRHPMSLYRPSLHRMATVTAARLSRHVDRRVTLAAWLITGKVVHTRNGQPMEFLTFEDETAVVETTFFPAAYRRFCHCLDRNRPYLLSGRVQRDWGALTLTVDAVRPLPPLSQLAGADEATSETDPKVRGVSSELRVPG